MTFPPATAYTPEALLRRFIKLYYALGFDHGSSKDQEDFKKWFNTWWMCLFIYIKGIRPVPWYDARWWRISDEHRKEVLNLVARWGDEADKGELMLNELPYPLRAGVEEFELTEPRPAVHKQERYRTPDILQLIRSCPERDIFGVMPSETLETFRRAIRPSDYNPDALGQEAHSLGHSIFQRYSHRQRAIYGL
ncbi:hypothetical protein NBRC10512_003417 [Rhodotorula toruloides]|uniref:RHTO0S18e01596g1_1 n=2 Tax=Rhodotorula toruloides TaxID=5286 RepID=A0A061BEV3_RHOTO|nr:uncharacterized protein RHTO_01899 [Rhodotorula toruloides NP11]EMS21433.1 hypothetical protein RHTO_01899 [Rhodotorula toruloides NP11]KAJ8291287.1 hypothetical protein OF846_005329 [Rhodotorula toruloides]CDR48508.1 RHTO0S18e01596g1_1 [Rhodotorula toruloides]